MNVAVLDFGKTNSKLLVFGQDGKIVWEWRTRPQWTRHGQFGVLDEGALRAWSEEALSRSVAEHGVGSVMVSGHGCTFALIDGDRLVHPILDYEQEPPADVAAAIDARVPDFSETFSPRLPLGFNYGRHMLWLQTAEPGAFEQATAILGYPQYWSWRLGGRPVSEVSYLGCHSHLWAPLRRDFSSLVDATGWRAKMPPFARAGDVIGECRVSLPSGVERSLDIHNGVHDSNAALYAYRRLGLGSFTLVSTGTWVVILNPNGPLEALDRNRDMLANVDVDGNPVATIRFMGGREFATISLDWRGPVEPTSIQRAIDKGIFALPSFAPGGPMQGHDGALVGPEPDASERAAAALLYVALMTDLSLELIASGSVVIVDGGLTSGGVLVELLAQLRPQQSFLQGANPEGSATGAAALAFESLGKSFAAECPVAAAASDYRGLEAYRRAWRAMAEAGEGRPLRGTLQ